MPNSPDCVQRITRRGRNQCGSEATDKRRQVLRHQVKQTELHCHVGGNAYEYQLIWCKNFYTSVSWLNIRPLHSLKGNKQQQLPNVSRIISKTRHLTSRIKTGVRQLSSDSDHTTRLGFNAHQRVTLPVLGRRHYKSLPSEGSLQHLEASWRLGLQPSSAAEYQGDRSSTWEAHPRSDPYRSVPPTTQSACMTSN